MTLTHSPRRSSIHRRWIPLAAATALSAGLLTGTVGIGQSSADPDPSTAATSTTTTPPTTATPSTGPADAPTPASTEVSAPPSVPAATTTQPAPTTTPPATTPSTSTPTTTKPATERSSLILTSFVSLPGGIEPVAGVHVRLINAETGQTYRATTGTRIFLPFGSYTFSATSWPDGYHLVHGSGGVHLDTEYGTHIQIILAHDLPEQSATALRIVKRDRVSGEPLAGAQFAISTCDGRPVASGTSGPMGVVYQEVAPGCYRATETAAPAGYLAEARAYTFEVTRGKIALQNVYNLPLDHVTWRNPSSRVALSAIPSGPVDQP